MISQVWTGHTILPLPKAEITDTKTHTNLFSPIAPFFSLNEV